jgi:beta-galactosidase/beta-glucuronidase
LSKIHVVPDAINGRVSIETYIEGGESDVEVIISYGGRELVRELHHSFFRHTFDIALPEIHLWELGNGRLYDLDIKVGDDLVHSYFGLRSVSYEGKKFMLNGKSVFQNLVLDQGYYENGIYTAETEEELVRDIYLAMELGYNGARLHQKVFEPRFLYHCDKLGYMVWGEYPSWGFHDENVLMLGKFLEEWTEAIERDYNHPSIISWCPLNESWGNLSNRKRTRDPRIMEAVYWVTKSLDPSRPCIDTSGGQHGRYTDVFDVHTYLKIEEFEKQMKEIENEEPLNFLSLYAPDYAQEDLAYDHKLPINISEYGGIAYDKNGEGWGYTAVTNEDDFVDRFTNLVDLIKNSKNISGYCYTQLYDVEQEQNGLLYYNRESKFSKDAIQKIAAANRKTALIEN